jgi:hypothetical protein
MQVVEKTCDKCGFKCTQDDQIEWQEFQFFYYEGGYASVLGDEVTLQADLCMRCYRDVLGPYLKHGDGSPFTTGENS